MSDYNFSNIKTRKDLARFLKIPLKKLTFLLYIDQNLYTNFSIPKKSGGIRNIYAPNKNLKEVQRVIKQKLEQHINEYQTLNGIKNNVSHGFEKNKSIITNSEIHKNKKIVFNTDIKDFFSTIHFGRVKGFFIKNRYFQMEENIATMLAQLVCYKGALPQGSPTSPIIGNLICNTLDIKLLRLCKKFKLNYTRYADDLTFSTNNKRFLDEFQLFYKNLEEEVNQSGFLINTNKNRFLCKDNRQTVTGLTVNNKVNVNRDFYLKTRAMAHCLYNTGEFSIDGTKASIIQLEGRFSFINQLDKHQNIKKFNMLSSPEKKQNFFSNLFLNSREKEYQKFLFYKYFWSNSKPLIMTEGKTDILYIKAALKKYYKEYPELIEKIGEDKFHYKISFFKRSDRMKFFFSFVSDGADNLSNIFNYYIDNFDDKKNKSFNYCNYFKNKLSIPFKNPIIILYDNEGPGKPLHKAIDHVFNRLIGNKNDEKKKEKREKTEGLKKSLNASTPFAENILENIYFLTNPKLEDKNTEIEDLLTNITNNLELDGKSFNKDGGKNNLGKNILSQYVYKNYKKIDLNSLKPILDNIKNVKSKYF